MRHDPPDTALRLFVAVYPSREVADALLSLCRRLDLARARYTPVAQIHLTLQFIGNADPRELDDIRESVRRATGGIGGFSLSPTRLIRIPPSGPMRVVAAETDAPPPLLELQRRLAHRLARNPRDRDSERYLPHLTVCRFSGPGPTTEFDHPLSLPAFAVDRVDLMSSVLTQRGAEHELVERIDLTS